jgi:hypothetical protein
MKLSILIVLALSTVVAAQEPRRRNAADSATSDVAGIYGSITSDVYPMHSIDSRPSMDLIH